MSAGGWRLRDAVQADASALAGFAERTFRDTFAADNTPEDMDAYCASAFGEERQRAEIADPRVVTVLAESPGGALAGYLQIGEAPGPPGVEAERPWELKRLYVDRALKGGGLGQGLMEHATERALARGADLLWLGVWERNPRAIRFYEKHGFREVGDHVFHVGNDPQRDLLMARRLERNIA